MNKVSIEAGNSYGLKINLRGRLIVPPQLDFLSSFEVIKHNVASTHIIIIGIMVGPTTKPGACETKLRSIQHTSRAREREMARLAGILRTRGTEKEVEIECNL